jgi:iron complex outermembrane recepter protein
LAKTPPLVPLTEASVGDYGYKQLRGYATGPLTESVAARLSISGTQRDGVLENVKTGEDVNTLDNLGVRGQLLWKPGQTKVRLILEQTKQDPNGQAQVYAGVVKTQRSAYRQFESIIKDLNYQPASRDPFDRVIDHNSNWRSGNKISGAALNIDTPLAGGTLTSTTAQYNWEWRPSNDRDWLGLNVVALSQATSDHEQLSQELRWTGDINETLSAVVGVYGIDQKLRAAPVQIEEAGADQWRFLQPNAAATQWRAPGLLSGVGSATTSGLDSTSAALFGQLEWSFADSWRLQTGARYNYDKKAVDFSRTPYFIGDESKFNAAQLTARRSVYSAQAFKTDISDKNFTGLLSWFTT